MRIIGIDPSSRKLAIIIMTEDDNEVARSLGLQVVFSKRIIEVPTKEKHRPTALAFMLTSTRTLFDAYVEDHDTYVFIEDPVMGRAGPKATMVQSQVHGIVQAVALLSGASGVYSVNNRTWKKSVVGSGNAAKSDSREWLGRERPDLLRVCGDDEDLVDAACIALYGAGVVRRSVGLTG